MQKLIAVLGLVLVVASMVSAQEEQLYAIHRVEGNTCITLVTTTDPAESVPDGWEPGACDPNFWDTIITYGGGSTAGNVRPEGTHCVLPYFEIEGLTVDSDHSHIYFSADDKINEDGAPIREILPLYGSDAGTTITMSDSDGNIVRRIYVVDGDLLGTLEPEQRCIELIES